MEVRIDEEDEKDEHGGRALGSSATYRSLSAPAHVNMRVSLSTRRRPWSRPRSRNLPWRPRRRAAPPRPSRTGPHLPLGWLEEYNG